MNLANLNFIEATAQRFSKLNLNKVEKQIELPPIKAEKANAKERINHLVLNRFEPFDIANERLINGNDLMSINYLQLGFIASNSVCRIHVKNSNGANEGYATGFLITPHLLITNNHVFGKKEDAINSLAEFNYQYDILGKPATSYFFTTDVSKFFYTHPELDFSIVYINQISENNNKNLSDFGFLKLTEDPNKALIAENVSIIQHPSGQYKQIAIRENQVIAKDGHFITYSTDTTQGSSGSPVFNDQWQVVALHHSGVPKKDKKGNYLSKDGRIYTPDMDDSLIDWIANEGVRISTIYQNIKNNLPYLQSQFATSYIEEIFNPPITRAQTEVTEKNQQSVGFQNNENTIQMDNKITFTVPLEISVGIGSNPHFIAAKLHSQTGNTPTHPSFSIEKAENQNYTERNGYDAQFISTKDFKMELKTLLKSQTKKLAPLLNPTKENENLLHYFNFSIAMHKNRKLCLITAVNIDGNRLDSVKRENTRWIIDPRMDEKFQTGPVVYANNDLDRGHMVRRLDPVWGDHAEAANNDTFHFSNATPQHKNLNQKTWLSLENYILDNADLLDVKASVFTGPIFSEDDIPYRGVLLPLQFWKVAAMIKADGTPSVTGYMLKQPDNIDDFRTMEGIKEDGFGEFKTYQVPLQKIAHLTGIAFDQYNEYDPLKGVDFNETSKLIEITSKTDIKL